MLFTRPYYVYAEQLVVRHDDDRIHDLADCHDKAVGTLAGSAAERLLGELGVREVVAFEGQIEPYLDLELGRLDAVLLDTIIALYYASANPKLKYTGAPSHRGQYAIATRPEDRELAAALDQALGELVTNGRLLTILRRWHLWNDDQLALVQQTDEENAQRQAWVLPPTAVHGPTLLPN